jgi:hypothetical protein
LNSATTKLRRKDERKLLSEQTAIRDAEYPGVIALCDSENGYPLAVMDSIEISILRAGAATGVAAGYLARPDASVASGNRRRVSRAVASLLARARAISFGAIS